MNSKTLAKLKELNKVAQNENTKTVTRWMLRADLDRVADIDKLCFWEPWDRELINTFMKTKSACGVVTEVETQAGEWIVVGYNMYMLQPDVLSIIRMGVDPAHRRRGHGTAMWQRAQNSVDKAKRKYITAHVDEYSLSGQVFLRSMGAPCVETDQGRWGRVCMFVWESEHVAFSEDEWNNEETAAKSSEAEEIWRMMADRAELEDESNHEEDNEYLI